MSNYGIVTVESTVFDWATIKMTNADFQKKFTSTDASGNTSVDRYGMVEYVKSKSGIDTSKYVGFIVIFSDPVGTAFSAGSDAIFEPSIVQPTLICHEMQHMFGEPDHAFDFTTRQTATWAQPGEYWDQTDVMSAGNCWGTPTVPNQPFSGTGPNLNMMWRDQWGWLLASYIRRISDTELNTAFDQTLTLGARNYNTGQGLMCIQFDDIYIELAVGGGTNTDDFDGGLPGSGILIHQRLIKTWGGGTHTVSGVLVKDLANQQ